MKRHSFEFMSALDDVISEMEKEPREAGISLVASVTLEVDDRSQ